MSTELIEELAQDPRLLYPHTVAEYHRMISLGLIEEGAPYELIDGQVVRKARSARGEDPLAVGDEHIYVVMKLTEFGRGLKKFGCHLRAQQPLTLPPNNEPEPDAAIVRGTIEDYRDKKPSAADTLCVFEVADASLRRDRTTKQEIYASAGIEMYVIINLRARVAEVFTQPKMSKGKYSERVTLSARQSLEIPTPGGKKLSLLIGKMMR
jgi:Uma2 family endonuclease